jgi:dTDP-4-dehydrorhamnose reductase
MMKVLIIGAKGTLGRQFLLTYKDEDVHGWDREEIDITDPIGAREKIKAEGFELVINCAAYNAVDKAEEEGSLAEQVNGHAPGFLAEACRETGAVFVHFSTNYVFDGRNCSGYNETDGPNPVSAYGRSKLLGEEMAKKKGDKCYVIRTAMLFGRPGSGKKTFPDLMLEMAGKEQSIKAVCDETGNPTYVLDLSQATRALLEEKKAFGIYHLTNSATASWHDFASEIFRIKDIKKELVPVAGALFNRPAKRPRCGALNNTKFLKLRPWQEALEEYLSS